MPISIIKKSREANEHIPKGWAAKDQTYGRLKSRKSIVIDDATPMLEK